MRTVPRKMEEFRYEPNAWLCGWDLGVMEASRTWYGVLMKPFISFKAAENRVYVKEEVYFPNIAQLCCTSVKFEFTSGMS